jgi:DNA end-binding protein Ku
MERTERAALGRFVMRTKEYLVLIRARGGRRVLTTLLWHDEVRPAKDVPKPTKRDKPAKKEVDQAVALVDALSCDWDPSRYEDSFQKRLRRSSATSPRARRSRCPTTRSRRRRCPT